MLHLVRFGQYELVHGSEAFQHLCNFYIRRHLWLDRVLAPILTSHWCSVLWIPHLPMHLFESAR
jgi:hypothetical protein